MITPSTATSRGLMGPKNSSDACSLSGFPLTSRPPAEVEGRLGILHVYIV